MTKAPYDVKRSKIPILVAIACFAIQAVLHGYITTPSREAKGGKGTTGLSGLETGPWIVAAAGFREVVASWLWIKCDELFHQGDYQALVPIMHAIVRLDPHQIDVYATGAWHMLYNFVDSQERSDRRYIPEGLGFLADGIKNNPDPFDLYHEMGWMLFDDKLRRYEEATGYFIQAAEHHSPPYYHHTIAHSYEREGNIDACIDWWGRFMKETQADLKKQPNAGIWLERMAICEHNRSRVIISKNRLADLRAHPIDPQLDLDVEVVAPYKLWVHGTSKLTLGCRIYVDLQDIDYEETLAKSFAWRLKHVTVMEDSQFVWPNGSFGVTEVTGAEAKPELIDLSRDPTFFPFTRDRYRLIISFNPRSAPAATNNPHRLGAQDVFGWSGEGIADNPWLYIDKTRPAHVDGKVYPLRMLRKEVIITKDELAKKAPFDFRKAAGLPPMPRARAALPAGEHSVAE
jgi:tetratricopeptide (TPR) repeat protein